jgi:signal transduction histidine kinase
MIKQLKGAVSYTSQPGNGTTFHLKLPIQDGKTLEGQHVSRAALAR